MDLDREAILCGEHVRGSGELARLREEIGEGDGSRGRDVGQGQGPDARSGGDPAGLARGRMAGHVDTLRIRVESRHFMDEEIRGASPSVSSADGRVSPL